MLVLGLTGGPERLDENLYDLRFDEIHDSAAVLVRDGVVLAGIEQERLNRIKHTNKAPGDAIRACLELGGVTAHDLDAVAYYATEPFCGRVLEQLHLRNFAAPELLTGRTMVQRMVRLGTGAELDPARIRFVSHHWAHGVSAFHQSGFSEAVVLSLDGQGEGVSGMIFTGRGARLEPVRSLSEQDSLGYLYRDVIRFLGYEMFDEYKVMGMAPYGNPARFRLAFRALYDLLPDGGYKLHLDRAAGLYRLAQPRRRGEAFTREHQDIAAALQEALEIICLHLIAHFTVKTGLRRVCLAGGVAHNCSMNGKLLSSGVVDQLFVQPAAHDAGCALGAALSVGVAESPAARVAPIDHVYWGRPIGDDQRVATILDQWADVLSAERVPDICERAATLLAQGKVLGWVQGRSEFGPRALGNRSIVADPRPAAHKAVINAMVKKREGYRPFAPSVLEERAGEFFVLPPAQTRFPYMSVIVEVQPDKRELLGAVTHVDGTARIQTVTRAQNSRYYDLIAAFGRLTGVPVLLNTSFNNHAEPIVDSVEDAIVCFLTTGLHYLVIGDRLISKRPLVASVVQQLVIVPVTGLTLRLAQEAGGPVYQAAHGYHHGRSVPISDAMFEVLRRADGARTLADLCGGQHAMERLAAELLELWSNRMVALRPRVSLEGRLPAQAAGGVDANPTARG
jgi:carbamoyltransferase